MLLDIVSKCLLRLGNFINRINLLNCGEILAK